MRFTIEPTEAGNANHRTVSVAKPSDDLDVHALMELVRAALLAYGFHPDSIKEAFGED